MDKTRRIIIITIIITVLLSVLFPQQARADEIYAPKEIGLYSESDGFTYRDGELYFNDLRLDENGMYEYTDTSGQIWYYDPMDPEFLHYFSDEAGESEAFVEKDVLKAVQGSSGDSFYSDINGLRYLYPAYVEGKDVVNGIDVSYYQQSVNWRALANKGVKYAIIRAGYRGYGKSDRSHVVL